MSAVTPDDEAARRLQGHLDAECWCDLIPVEPHWVGDPHPAGTFDLTAPTPDTPATTWPTEQEADELWEVQTGQRPGSLNDWIRLQVAAREAEAEQRGVEKERERLSRAARVAHVQEASPRHWAHVATWIKDSATDTPEGDPS